MTAPPTTLRGQRKRIPPSPRIHSSASMPARRHVDRGELAAVFFDERPRRRSSLRSRISKRPCRHPVVVTAGCTRRLRAAGSFAHSASLHHAVVLQPFSQKVQKVSTAQGVPRPRLESKSRVVISPTGHTSIRFPESSECTLFWNFAISLPCPAVDDLICASVDLLQHRTHRVHRTAVTGSHQVGRSHFRLDPFSANRGAGTPSASFGRTNE